MKMSRKSQVALAAESALVNLNAIHEIASEDRGNSHAVYLRNAGDCSRWCAALRTAGVAYPPFMYAAGLNYFGRMWRLTA
jgi:hypothetical protein